MTKITPAILVSSKEEYDKKLAIVRQLTGRFQLDIVDGEFADNRTVDPSQISRPNDLKMDVQLMVARPSEYLPRTLALRPHLVIIEFECQENLEPLLAQIKQAGSKAGLAIAPKTTVAEIENLFPTIDHLLIMGVEPGFSGQKLIPEVLEKASQARKIRPELEIGLDGGVSADNLSKIATADFDVISVNTYLFAVDDPASRYSELMEAFK